MIILGKFTANFTKHLMKTNINCTKLIQKIQEEALNKSSNRASITQYPNQTMVSQRKKSTVQYLS